MTTDISEWGPRLYAYLERHWTAEGATANRWAYAHGIQGASISRWKTGDVTPSLERMVDVAAALDVTVLDVLIAAGVVDEADAKRPASLPVPPSIDAAIAHDPDLSPELRRSLRDFVAAWRRVDAREVEEVRSAPRKARRRGR